MAQLSSFSLAAAERAKMAPMIPPKINRPPMSSQALRATTGFSEMRTVLRRLVGGNAGPSGTEVISRSNV